LRAQAGFWKGWLKEESADASVHSSRPPEIQIEEDFAGESGFR
jgi:hypothetical protein